MTEISDSSSIEVTECGASCLVRLTLDTLPSSRNCGCVSVGDAVDGDAQAPEDSDDADLLRLATNGERSGLSNGLGLCDRDCDALVP